MKNDEEEGLRNEHTGLSGVGTKSTNALPGSAAGKQLLKMPQILVRYIWKLCLSLSPVLCWYIFHHEFQSHGIILALFSSLKLHNLLRFNCN